MSALKLEVVERKILNHRKRMMESLDSIEAFLFAEKVVQITMAMYDIPYQKLHPVLEYFSGRHFTEVVSRAVKLLVNELGKVAQMEYQGVSPSNSYTSEEFISYVKEKQEILFSDPDDETADPHDVLNFFVLVSCLSALLYSNGVKEAPYLATVLIYQCFKDCLNFDWKVIEETAPHFGQETDDE